MGNSIGVVLMAVSLFGGILLGPTGLLASSWESKALVGGTEPGSTPWVSTPLQVLRPAVRQHKRAYIRSNMAWKP